MVGHAVGPPSPRVAPTCAAVDLGVEVDLVVEVLLLTQDERLVEADHGFLVLEEGRHGFCHLLPAVLVFANEAIGSELVEDGAKASGLSGFTIPAKRLTISSGVMPSERRCPSSRLRDSVTTPRR